MPSYNALWIPTLVAAQVLGLVILLYALEQLNGTVSGLIRLVKWKCGCYSAAELEAWAAANKGQQLDAAQEENLPERKKKGKKRKKAKDAKRPKGKGKEKEKEKEKEVDGQEVSVAVEPDESEGLLPIPVELTWEDVSYTIQPGGPSTAKKVLHDSSGQFFPCEAIAIMGPSGAGKSTLLDILSGQNSGKGVAGRVSLNGMEISPETSNTYLSYVGQEDVFMPTLSAWESLSFISQLCMAPLPHKELHARMEAVLTTMGLSRVRNSKVGGYLPGGVPVRGLSGGERRRLSIACGLIGNPSILFLDEPTTGLDSFAALAVMKYLNALTNRGHTVVSSIHQPRQEIFSSFDKVLILSEGYLLYLAPPNYVVPWFSQVLSFPYSKERDGTVADWLISITAVGFRKGDDSKARSMSSVEEVKAAAEKFASSSQVVREAEDAVATFLETEDLDSVRSFADGAADGSVRDGTPAASVIDGATPSVMSGSIFSGPSSMGGMNLLHAYGSVQAPASLKATEEGGTETGTVDGTTSLPVARRYSRSWMFQFWMLWKRSVMHQIRNPAEAAGRTLTASISGIVPGLVWIRLNDDPGSAQQRLALLFFTILMFCMTPFGVMAFPLADKRFFILDSSRGLYAPSAYTVAYILSNIPFFIINTWASGLVLYGLVGLRYQAWAILQYAGVLSLHALVANQFVTSCIWIASSQDMAFSLATIYISFSLLICGFYIRVRDMTLSIVRGLTWASFSKYTFQALANTELKNRVWASQTCPVVSQVEGFGQAVPLCYFPQNFILEYYDLNVPVAKCCAALLAFWAFFCLLSYYALVRLYKRRQ